MNTVPIPIQTDQPLRPTMRMTFQAALSLARHGSKYSGSVPVAVVGLPGYGDVYTAVSLADVEEGETVCLLFLGGEMLR